MRIRVSHQIVHRFDPPARTVNQILRLTPLSFDSQYVLRWRLDIDADGARRETEDAHGNAVTSYSRYGPIERVTISAVGEVETSAAAGIVRGAAERLPPEMYLRDSPLAQVNGALRAFAAEATSGGANALDSMHRLMAALNETLPHHPEEKDGADSAIEAFALRRARARWKLPHLPTQPLSADVMRGPGSSTSAGCSGTARYSSAWRSIGRSSKSPRRCSATT